MSPLEAAIAEVAKRGWRIKGLGRSPFDSVRPWSCDVYPGHLGEYVWGKPKKTGLYTSYEGGMTRITVDGASALETVQNAIQEIDKSRAKKLYSRLEKVLAEWELALRAQARDSR